MSTTITFRKATLDDLPTIVHQRVGMFTDMGVDPQRIQAMEAPFRAWVIERMNEGVFETWLACDGDQVVAGAGLWLFEWMPSPLALRTVRAYILNVYTERAYRRQGIARRLIEQILDHCRAKSIDTVLLHASQQGRPIYEGLGFVQTNEMRINL